MQKLLLSGHASDTLRSLRSHGLSHGLLPLLDVILEQPLGTRFIEVALAGTDARVREGKTVSPAFLFATLLWHEVLQQWTTAKGRGEKPLPSLYDAMDRVLSAQAQRISVPPARAHIGDLGTAARVERERERVPIAFSARASTPSTISRDAQRVGRSPQDLGTGGRAPEVSRRSARRCFVRTRGRRSAAARRDAENDDGGGAAMKPTQSGKASVCRRPRLSVRNSCRRPLHRLAASRRSQPPARSAVRGLSRLPHAGDPRMPSWHPGGGPDRSRLLNEVVMLSSALARGALLARMKRSKAADGRATRAKPAEFGADARPHLPLSSRRVDARD